MTEVNQGTYYSATIPPADNSEPLVQKQLAHQLESQSHRKESQDTIVPEEELEGRSRGPRQPNSEDRSNTGHPAESEQASTEPDPADVPPKIHFENQKYQLARDGWERQVKSCNYVLEKMANPDDGEEATISEEKKNEFLLLRKKARLNLSLVSLKLNDFGGAVKYADEVLAESPRDEKALYRRALGLFESGRLLEASQAIQSLATSSDVAVIKLKQQIERQVARKKLVETRMMQGVMAQDDRKKGLVSQWLSWNKMCVLAVAVGCCSIAIGTITLWGGSWRQALIRKGLINGHQG